MAQLDMSPAAIAARLAAAPANGSPYTYQDYLNAGNDPSNQQGNNNFGTAQLMGSPGYAQLVAQAQSGSPQAQQQLATQQQQVLAQSGINPSQFQAQNDTSSGEYGYGQDVNVGPDWKVMAAILGGPFAAQALAGVLGGGAAAGAGAGAASTAGAGAAATTGAGGALGGGVVGGSLIPGAGTAASGASTLGASALTGGGAAASQGFNWGSLAGPAIQTAGSLINGAVQQGNTAAQLKNQQLQQALGATQTNPYTQLQDTQKQALAGMLAQNYTPQTYTPGHASTGLGDPTTAGTFNGGIGAALQHLSDPSVASVFGQPAYTAAANNFNSVASNNPFYTSQLAGVLGGPMGGSPSTPSPGASAGTNTSAVSQQTNPLGAIPPIPGLSQGPTTPTNLAALSKSLTGGQQQSNLPFQSGFSSNLGQS